MSTHVWDRLSAYIDRELAQTERAAVDAHLRECADCARAVEEMRAVDALARGHEVEAPAGYFESLPGRLRTRLSPRARGRVAPWAVALAAGLAVAVMAPLVLRDQPGPQPTARRASAPSSSAAPADPAAAREAPAPEANPAAAAAAAGPSPSPPAALMMTKEAGDAAGGLRAQRGPAVPRMPAAPPPPAMQAPLQDERSVAAGEDAAEEGGFAPPPPAVNTRARRALPPRVLGPPPPAPAAAPEGEAAGREAEVDEEAALVSDNSGPEREAAARPEASAGGARTASPTADPRFEALAGRAARSAAEARALRDAWRAYVRENPRGPRADAARVAGLEAGAAAWRLGGRPEDRAAVEREGREYLRRPEAADKERVRALLAGLQP